MYTRKCRYTNYLYTSNLQLMPREESIKLPYIAKSLSGYYIKFMLMIEAMIKSFKHLTRIKDSRVSNSGCKEWINN